MLRYVVEPTSALLHEFRHLATRCQRRLDLHEALVALIWGPICWRRLKTPTRRSCDEFRAIVAAAPVWFAVTALNAPDQRDDPGVTLIMGGIGVAVLGVALILLVLRMLLAQAVARDVEAAQMQAELDELIEAERDSLLDLSRTAADHRCRLLRVRVVEQPLTPCLHWELHLLRVRAQCGELISVFGPEHIARYEHNDPLPELITPGPDTVYDIGYNTKGEADGAVRYVDPDIRNRTADFIGSLYELGEDVEEFFARQVAVLHPPQGA